MFKIYFPYVCGEYLLLSLERDLQKRCKYGIYVNITLNIQCSFNKGWARVIKL